MLFDFVVNVEVLRATAKKNPASRKSIEEITHKSNSKADSNSTPGKHGSLSVSFAGKDS